MVPGLNFLCDGEKNYGEKQEDHELKRRMKVDVWKGLKGGERLRRQRWGLWS